MQIDSIGGQKRMDKLFQSKWFIKVISLVLAITLYIFVTVETNTAQNDSRVNLGVANEVQVLDDVPLDIRIDPNQYVVSGVPEHVTVSLEGKTSVLTPIVRQRTFSVFVDLRDLSEGEHTVELEYENIPDDLTVYIEPKTIDVNIEKRASKEFAVDVDFVNMSNLPLGYELGEAEVSPETVVIVSSESIIEQIAMVKIFIDVSDLKESIRNREVPVSVYDIQGNDLKVKVEPASVTVSVPVERPSKKVPLNITTKGELPEGFELDKMEAPEEIEIFGRRDALNEIDVISTKEIDLSKVDESGEYEIELDFPEGIIANEEKLNVEIDLIQSKLFEEISIDTNESDDLTINFVNPDKPHINITATGIDSLIKDLAKKDIIASIDIGNLEAGEHKVDLTITGPDDIDFKPERKSVTIQLE